MPSSVSLKATTVFTINLVIYRSAHVLNIPVIRRTFLDLKIIDTITSVEQLHSSTSISEDYFSRFSINVPMGELKPQYTPSEYQELGVGVFSVSSSTESSEFDGAPKEQILEELPQTCSSTIKQRICCCCGERCTRTWNKVTSLPLCPSEKKFARIIAMCVFGLLLWGSAYAIIGYMAGPGGQLFKVGILGVTSYLAGWLVSLTGLPDLLGMLIMGIFLRNIGFVVFSGEFLHVAACLRKMSLALILIRAGLGLDSKALKRLGGMVARLAIVPSLAEICFMALISHFLLDLPWIWGFLIGTVMAAVSPAVVIPCLFRLQDRGYGRSKGIPTLVIAAASFDDIIAISLFGVMLSVTFSTGNLTMQILRGPLGIIFGMLCGISFGILLRYIPHKDDKRVTMLRTMLLAGGGMMFMFGSEAVGYEGAGPLGGIVAAFVASNGWNPKGFNGKPAVQDNFAVLWTVFQPILFGLIGSEIDIFVLEGKTVALGIACILVGLSAKIFSSVLVAAGGNMTWKEKLFISFAWFPKATVQAAIGPVALDSARLIGDDILISHATKVLIVAVLAILFTAPVGACLLTFFGPKLLKKERITFSEPNEQNQTVQHTAEGLTNPAFNE